MPTTYLGLLSAAADSGTYTEVHTPGLLGYARVALGTGGSSKFGTASLGNSTNSAGSFVFTPSNGTWTNAASYWGIFNASSGGTLLFYGAIEAYGLPLSLNDTLTIPTNSINFQRDTGSFMNNNYWNIFWNHALGKASYTTGTKYIGLWDGDPNGAGVESETAGSNGYARQTALMNSATNALADNSTARTFGAATAAWGVTDYFNILSASTGGTAYGGDAWDTSRTIANGDSAQIAVQDLVVVHS